jgi:hypothetical protein
VAAVAAAVAAVAVRTPLVVTRLRLWRVAAISRRPALVLQAAVLVRVAAVDVVDVAAARP